MTKNVDVVKTLNVLLSNYQIAISNIQKFHWLVKGNTFFQTHKFTEELYDNLRDKADEIAELILTLGEVPEYKYSEYLKLATIKEDCKDVKEISSDYVLKQVKEYVSSFIETQTLILKRIEDQQLTKDKIVIENLLTSFIEEQYKYLWMIDSTLKN